MKIVLRKVAIIILGGVPIMVIMPPKILAKARGINIILGERFCLIDVFNATGNINAKAPTLFMIAENIDAIVLKLDICII
tara:strand:+ start:454 stop:693 length:240 start_codon:yes stop_codon:yes gene_type:complete